MELFTEQLFETFGDDHFALAVHVTSTSIAAMDDRSDFSDKEVLILQEAEAILLALNDVNTLPIKYERLKATAGVTQQLALYRSLLDFQDALDKISRQNHAEQVRSRAVLLLGRTFKYEFTSGDIDRIQELLNEAREWLTKSAVFTDEHRDRILRRLEQLQRELHKKMSNLDKFWGLLGDAGVAIGKFGDDAKPFVDRVREIMQIAGRTQSRAEELPSGDSLPQIEWSKESE